MEILIRSLFGTLVLAAVVSSNVGAQSPGVRRVAWLQGCWESASSDRVIEEQWMAPRGNSMIAVSRTTRGDKLVDHELIVVRQQGDQLAYEAHPAGQRSAVFLSRTLSDSSVVFENLQHDFPQRIGYQRKGSDALLAWIEGTQNGQLRRVEFPYRRVTCSGV